MPNTENVHLYRNPKTGKIWKIGQELNCLAAELSITQDAAGALLEAGRGQDVRSILDLLGTGEMCKKIAGARDRAAYMRGIVKSESARSKPTRPVSATSKPIPQPEALPPTERPAARQERLDALVSNAMRVLGGERYTVEEIRAELAKKFGRLCKTEKLEAQLVHMSRRGACDFAQGLDGPTYYGLLERSEPAGEFVSSM